MSDIQTATTYYQDLLAYQHINQPKARATIGLLAQAALVDLLPMQLVGAFDINTAVGPQLDILGEYIGFNRLINQPITRTWFSFDDYVSPLATPYGFTSYTDLNQNISSSIESYAAASYLPMTLNDDEYRLLLKLKILVNSSLATFAEIKDDIYAEFGSAIVISDGCDMTIEYLAQPSVSRLVKIAGDQAILPKPMGVRLVGIFQLNVPANLWGLTSYLTVSGSTIGFSSYAGGFNAGVMLSYVQKM